MDNKVSVIVPIYNAEKFIKRCIDSILNQTLKNIEIILIDDGSSDNSGVICDEYQRIDERVKVIHIQNLGPSNARNIGIAEAKGEYIGFVDSDDYVEKDMYEQLYTQANIFNSQMCCSSFYSDKLNSSTVIKLPLESNKLLDKNYISLTLVRNIAQSNDAGIFSLWNKIYRREFLLQQNIWMDITRSHGEDWVFNLELYKKYSNITYIDKPFYHYLQTDSGLFSIYRESFFTLCLDGRIRMLDLFKSYGISPNEYIQRTLKFYYEFINQIGKIYSNTTNRIKRKELIDEIVKNNHVRNCCGEILHMNRECLTQNSMSRKDKILPLIIKYFPATLTYKIFNNEGFRKKYFK